MNKSSIVTLVLLLLLFIGLGLYLHHYGIKYIFFCEEEKITTVENKAETYKAKYYIADCGALDGWYTVVSIKKNDPLSFLKKKGENEFIVHSQLGRDYNLNPQWISNNHLVITISDEECYSPQVLGGSILGHPNIIPPRCNTHTTWQEITISTTTPTANE